MNYPDIVVDCGLIISVLAFVVSAVTEVTKNVSFLKKIPTQLQVIVLSVVLTVGTYVGYCMYVGSEITFFYVFASFFGGFVVALVAQNGWESVRRLYDRVSSKKDGE